MSTTIVLLSILIVLIMGVLLQNHIRVKVIFRWYDIWIGSYIDIPNRSIYVFLIPMIGIKVTY